MSVMARKSSIWSTGLAMFSMFFGAGNIVFPLALGQLTLDKNHWAVFGMILSAVVVPLMGLLAMLLYEGNYNKFFERVGKIPGFTITLLILGLIGPFGGIPRCMTISYSTLNALGLQQLGMHLPVFSLLSCGLIYLFTFRPNRILALMGYVLTPILLLTLAVIVVKGSVLLPHADPSSFTRMETFFHGFVEGYHTMDLLAAFFFSSVVLVCLRRETGIEKVSEALPKRQMNVALISSLVAASLLALVYVSFSFLAAGFSHLLGPIPQELLLGTLTQKLLGTHAGLVAGTAVAFACLTTEIALTAVFAEFLRRVIFQGRISYPVALLSTLGTSFFISTLQFQGISAFLAPILQVCYPALIVLTVVNILHKLYDFKPVKSFFYGALGLSLVCYLLSS